MNQSELKSDLIAWLEQQWDKAVKDSETPDKELLEKYTFYDGLTTAYEFTIARLNSAEGTEAPTVRSGRFTYPHALPLLVGKGLADKYTERLTAKGRELIEQVNRLTERDWRNIPKVKIRRAAATLWPERFLDDEDEETRNNAIYFGRNRP